MTEGVKPTTVFSFATVSTHCCKSVAVIVVAVVGVVPDLVALLVSFALLLFMLAAAPIVFRF